MVLSDEGVLFTTYNIDSYNETELSLIMKNLHEDVLDGTLNITMICHIQPCLAVLKSVCIFLMIKSIFRTKLIGKYSSYFPLHINATDIFELTAGLPFNEVHFTFD